MTGGELAKHTAAFMQTLLTIEQMRKAGVITWMAILTYRAGIKAGVIKA